MGATISFNSEIRPQALLNSEEAVAAQPLPSTEYPYWDAGKTLTQTTLPTPRTSEPPELDNPRQVPSRREILQQILATMLEAMSSDDGDTDETIKALCLYIISLIGQSGAKGAEGLTLPPSEFTLKAHTGSHVSPKHNGFKQLLQTAQSLLKQSKTAQHTLASPGERTLEQQLQSCLTKLDKANIAQAASQPSEPEQESLIEQVLLLLQMLMAQQQVKKTNPIILADALDKTVSRFLDCSSNIINVTDDTTSEAELAQQMVNQGAGSQAEAIAPLINQEVIKAQLDQPDMKPLDEMQLEKLKQALKALAQQICYLVVQEMVEKQASATYFQDSLPPVISKNAGRA